MGKQATYNKTIIIGRLSSIGALCNTLKDPKKKKIVFDIKNNTIDKNGNESVNYQSITAFDKIAELVKTHLKQGDLCCVEGTFDNTTKSIIAEHITFLSGNHNKPDNTKN